VDVISGFSTDGRIVAYDLRSLEDDKNYFPPYDAAHIVRTSTLQQYPRLDTVFAWFRNRIPDSTMTRLNYEVESLGKSPEQVAAQFVISQGLKLNSVERSPELTVGSKNFTESYVLAAMTEDVIESLTGLAVEVKPGFGGTKFIFSAMEQGAIDVYPEYTGTGLLVILDNHPLTKAEISNKDLVYAHVKTAFQNQYQLQWMPRIGFNNTFALMMQDSVAGQLGIRTISDLSRYSRSLH